MCARVHEHWTGANAQERIVALIVCLFALFPSRVEDFAESDAAALAEELLDAYDIGDTEALAKVTGNQYFSFISTEVSEFACTSAGNELTVIPIGMLLFFLQPWLVSCDVYGNTKAVCIAWMIGFPAVP